MNVDEARSHHLARRVNDALCRASETPGQRPDMTLVHGDIALTAGHSTAINDLGTANNEVVHRVSPLPSQAALHSSSGVRGSPPQCPAWAAPQPRR